MDTLMEIPEPPTRSHAALQSKLSQTRTGTWFQEPAFLAYQHHAVECTLHGLSATGKQHKTFDKEDTLEPRPASQERYEVTLAIPTSPSPSQHTTYALINTSSSEGCDYDPYHSQRRENLPKGTFIEATCRSTGRALVGGTNVWIWIAGRACWVSTKGLNEGMGCRLVMDFEKEGYLRRFGGMKGDMDCAGDSCGN
ncbi:hypothetical protein P280DRAFT_485408 [Massarina eburnea CBS 473.64]|uniref:Uncharacterized protein n=1 Tax=Massarina eburnea CBS 473.64 TaxID=1395130 RepID=A0A6A6RJA1_9PLEO|nr:hypothetical protein P280DRAFT_485408 [Massarina eburnea CBS 473.64]